MEECPRRCVNIAGVSIIQFKFAAWAPTSSRGRGSVEAKAALPTIQVCKAISVGLNAVPCKRGRSDARLRVGPYIFGGNVER